MERNAWQAAGTAACQRCRKSILEMFFGDIKMQSVFSELKVMDKNKPNYFISKET